jgi:predicted secreted protein
MTGLDELKAAAAETITQCNPGPKSSSAEREWRTFMVKMLTSTTNKLILQAETADTPELKQTIVVDTRAFLDSVAEALRSNTFSKVMCVSKADADWPANADRIFKIEQEADRLQSAFDPYGLFSHNFIASHSNSSF